MRAKTAWLATLLALGAGCFADAPMVGGGTTGDPCPMGSRGCMCYPNGTCDPDLQCDAGSTLCVPEGCTPGAYACGCMNGSCTPPWVCEHGICGEGDPDSGGISSSSAGTSGDVDTSSDATSSSSSTDDSGPDDTGGSSTDTTTGGTSSCASEPSCSSCIDCARVGPCMLDHEKCVTTDACGAAVECQSPCAHFGFSCGSGCCEGLASDEAENADALTACYKQVCGPACPGGGSYPMCSG